MLWCWFDWYYTIQRIFTVALFSTPSRYELSFSFQLLPIILWSAGLGEEFSHTPIISSPITNMVQHWWHHGHQQDRDRKDGITYQVSWCLTPILSISFANIGSLSRSLKRGVWSKVRYAKHVGYLVISLPHLFPSSKLNSRSVPVHALSPHLYPIHQAAKSLRLLNSRDILHITIFTPILEIIQIIEEFRLIKIPLRS